MDNIEILNEDEFFHIQSENDNTYELSKRIAEHIQNWYSAKEVFHEKQDKIDFLKLASDVRMCLNDSVLSKKLENRLLDEFNKRLKKEGGITPKNEQYMRRFGELGIDLHDYNIDLLEKANFKEILLNQILQTKPSVLYKAGLEVDSNKNVFLEVGDFTECYCTKESIMEHFNKEIEMVNDLYSANDERYLKEEILEHVNENIKKLEIYDNNDILVLTQSKDDYEIYVADDEKGIASLENAISKINEEMIREEGEEL